METLVMFQAIILLENICTSTIRWIYSKERMPCLFGTLIVLFQVGKNTTIIIQGGMIKPDGSYVTETEDSYTMPNGKKYYTFGASVRSEYSGFENHPNMTRTGL